MNIFNVIYPATLFKRTKIQFRKKKKKAKQKTNGSGSDLTKAKFEVKAKGNKITCGGGGEYNVYSTFHSHAPYLPHWEGVCMP